MNKTGNMFSDDERGDRQGKQNYTCICIGCNNRFLGEKRDSMCARCLPDKPARNLEEKG